MKLDTYTVTLRDGQTFVIRGNMDDASAPIRVTFGPDDDDQLTPFQTADAMHSPMRAARLVAEYFQAGPGDCTDVASVN